MASLIQNLETAEFMTDATTISNYLRSNTDYEISIKKLDWLIKKLIVIHLKLSS